MAHMKRKKNMRNKFRDCQSCFDISSCKQNHNEKPICLRCCCFFGIQCESMLNSKWSLRKTWNKQTIVVEHLFIAACVKQQFSWIKQIKTSRRIANRKRKSWHESRHMLQNFVSDKSYLFSFRFVSLGMKVKTTIEIKIKKNRNKENHFGF